VSSNLQRSGPLVLFVALFFAAWTARALALAPLDRGLEPLWLRRVYLDGVRALLWVAPAWLYVGLVAKARAREFLRLTTPVDPRGLARGLAVAGGYLGAVALFAVTLEGRRFVTGRATDPAHWLGALASLAFLCFAEEVLFRGVFLREFAARLGFWLANVLTSALFAAIHWPGWYAHRGLVPGLVHDSVGVFAVGLVAGYLWKTTRSLWPAVGFHLANNLLVGLLA
jgi:membrane protease YdiL (CAAX protease family)